MRRVTLSDALQRFRMSPVWWANFGPLSRRIASRSPPSAQPLLIISHPRSGSTWVGNTLGHSPTALYLKEPVALTHLLADPGSPVFEFPDSEPPQTYVRAASSVAMALPSFPPNIVSFPRQWALRERGRGRLVVKEVNPMAIRWFIAMWRPRIVYLVRHPAAVAASFAARGWLGGFGRAGFERRFRARVEAGEIRPERHSGSVWAGAGAIQAIAHKLAIEQLREWPDHIILRYEDLCSDPITVFRRLCDFGGLEWSQDVERTIRLQSGAEAHNRGDAYGTLRDSRLMPQLWRSDLKPGWIAELKESYLAYDPPFYREEEW